MEKLMEILKTMRPDVDFEKETKLIDNGILDSFDIINLVGELMENFDVEIGADELEAENFNSADAILKMITRLQDE